VGFDLIRVYLRFDSGFLGALGVLGGSIIVLGSLGVLAVRNCLIGVYRRSSAANLVLDLIRVYLRFHSGSLGVLAVQLSFCFSFVSFVSLVVQLLIFSAFICVYLRFHSSLPGPRDARGSLRHAEIEVTAAVGLRHGREVELAVPALVLGARGGFLPFFPARFQLRFPNQ
jgi:hypothetical protein